MAVGADHAGDDVADRHAVLHLRDRGRLVLAEDLQRAVLVLGGLRRNPRDVRTRRGCLTRQMLGARRIAERAPQRHGSLARTLDARIGVEPGRDGQGPRALLVGIQIASSSPPSFQCRPAAARTPPLRKKETANVQKIGTDGRSRTCGLPDLEFGPRSRAHPYWQNKMSSCWSRKVATIHRSPAYETGALVQLSYSAQFRVPDEVLRERLVARNGAPLIRGPYRVQCLSRSRVCSAPLAMRRPLAAVYATGPAVRIRRPTSLRPTKHHPSEFLPGNLRRIAASHSDRAACDRRAWCPVRQRNDSPTRRNS